MFCISLSKEPRARHKIMLNKSQLRLQEEKRMGWGERRRKGGREVWIKQSSVRLVRSLDAQFCLLTSQEYGLKALLQFMPQQKSQLNTIHGNILESDSQHSLAISKHLLTCPALSSCFTHIRFNPHNYPPRKE